MSKILFYINKYKIFIILSSIIVGLIIYLFLNSNTTETNNIILEKEEEKIISETIKVDIKGMVVNSGVVELNTNSRVIDAINASGGLKKGANTEYLNLSKKLKDGDVIIIYSNDYIESLKKENIVYIEKPCNCPDSINDACIKDEIVNEDMGTNDALVSINNSTKEELMTLPGIGESKADAIIKYRNENNGFKKLEDIMNVSGIGESAYSKIKDHIKL